MDGRKVGEYIRKLHHIKIMLCVVNGDVVKEEDECMFDSTDLTIYIEICSYKVLL